MIRRAVLVRWHRRIALGAALFLLVQFLTGTVLVFREQLVAASLPSVQGAPLPFDAIQERLRAAEPGAVLRKIEFPISGRPSYLAHFAANGDAYQVAIARDGTWVQRAGAVAATLETVRVLHEDLLAGEFGRALVALEAVTLLLLVVSGAWIWWPGRERALRSLRLPTRGATQAKLYGWHRSFGVVVGLLLLPSIATGFVLAIGAFVTWRAPNVPPPSTVAMQDAARLALAQSMFPTQTVRDLRFDRATGTIARVTFRDGDLGVPVPVSDVAFDPLRGTVSAVVDRQRFRGYDLFAGWAYPFHSAQVGGAPLRALLLGTGFGALALSVLGLSLWWVRRNRAAPART
jgi:uncharacterized iron-regulated membrane protein